MDPLNIGRSGTMQATDVELEFDRVNVARYRDTQEVGDET